MIPTRVRLSRSTRLVLTVLLVAVAALAVWICFSYTPWSAIPLIAAVLVLWRVQVMGVQFDPNELVIIGLFVQRRVPRPKTIRLERGSTLYVEAHGQEKALSIPIAFSAGNLQDSSPDGQTKRELQKAFEDWQGKSEV